MEFATPPWASCPRSLALSPCPGQFPKAPSYFCSHPSLPFSRWKLPEWCTVKHTQGGPENQWDRGHLWVSSPTVLHPSTLRPCLLGSGDLLNASCLSRLPTVSVSSSRALQTPTHDLPQPPLIIGSLPWHPWRNGGSHKVPLSFFFFTRNTDPSLHPVI